MLSEAQKQGLREAAEPIYPPARRVYFLGGSNRDRLQEELCDAMTAVQAAIAAVRKTAPNARDYHGEQMDLAVLASESRIARLKSVEAELLAMFDALDAERIPT